jgi:DNA-binding MurR/RpiR family transcriptional regulator
MNAPPIAQTVIAPESVDEFRARLAQILPKLPKRLRQCADYVILNMDRIAVSTVSDLAMGAAVPPSAVMRFCQLFGFSGFSEMQKLFREAFSPGWPDYETRLRNLRQQGAGTPQALLAEFIQAGRQSLDSLIIAADGDALGQAVQVLSRAQTIHVVGFRRAFPVAAYLAYVFEKMAVPAMLHDGLGKLDHRFAIREGDAVLAITFAPYSSETIDLAQEAYGRGICVVALTDRPTSPLVQNAHAVLIVPEVDFGAFRSLSATIAMAMALAVAVGYEKETAAQ